MDHVKLYTILGKSRATKGEIGIEIETEFTVPQAWPFDPCGIWHAKGDGSLRHNGHEFVLVKPIEDNEAKLTTIKSITDQINEPKRKFIQDSPRTSVHVHVNVMRLNLMQIINALLAYWIFEPTLMDHCGEDRVGNNFCLSLDQAENIAKSLRKQLDINKSSGVPFTYGLGNARYAGQNMLAISKFGSIEYRSMRGTSDPLLIHQWSSMLNNLVNKSASEFANPAALIDWYLDHDQDAFIDLLLTKPYQEIVRSVPEYDALMDINLGLLSDIAYSQDWDLWAKKIDNLYGLNNEKKAPGKKKVVDLDNWAIVDEDDLVFNPPIGANVNWARDLRDEIERR